MKKALSLLLCVVMLVTPALGAYADADKITQVEAVEVLTELGVMEGKEDGVFDPAGTLTRAEAAKILYLTLNGGEDNSNLTRPVIPAFTDIKGNWAEGYIAWATTARGIIAGRGNGLFDPDGEVTASELAKMALSTIGYIPEYEGLVGKEWRINVDTLAETVGLFEGVEIADTTLPIDRESAARIICNALTVPMITYDAYSWVVDGQLMTQYDARERVPVSTLLEVKFGKKLEDGKPVPLP